MAVTPLRIPYPAPPQPPARPVSLAPARPAVDDEITLGGLAAVLMPGRRLRLVEDVTGPRDEPRTVVAVDGGLLRLTGADDNQIVIPLPTTDRNFGETNDGFAFFQPDGKIRARYAWV